MSTTVSPVESLLSKFQSLANSHNYPWLFEYDGGNHKYHLHVSGLIHGDETGCLPSLIHTIQSLKKGSLKYGGRLSISLGNPEAARENTRYLESDLNRAFLDTDLKTHETARARVLMPLFNRADLLLDLHQTILKTQKPFYIFPHQEEALLWAKSMRLTQAFVDATPAENSQTRCADEFFWFQDKPAITLELSQKGLNPRADDLSRTALRRILSLVDLNQKGHSLDDIAKKCPPLNHYKTIYRHQYSAKANTLRSGLHNFMTIQAGERLNAPNTPEILAPMSGELLFPKYLSVPQQTGQIQPPKEIFRIIKKAK